MDDPRRQTPVTPDGRLGPAAHHPGRSDARYLERRNALARLAAGHRAGDRLPDVDYTETEHATWRAVHAALAVAHRAHASREVLGAREGFPVPPDRIPGLAETGARLRGLTGFGFTLTGGPVETRRFLGAMADGWFHAVPFVRHPAIPLYTPEPDVIHDMFGHGIHLSSPLFAELYRMFGKAALRAADEGALRRINRVYWYVLEFGVLAEAGEPKAYGAALLSSYGELARLPGCQVRPLDMREMARTPYYSAAYQPVLFAGRSLEHVREELGTFLDAEAD
ncbi:phenylalanine 4-monooxygenase [Streptoverticillium reticulum]|uniref:phenylalanine 4-monooxygenase n=1 Tax=Streptoverticillium reticulum TaxID=1433415 RepID=UPI0039BF6BC6